MPSAFDQVMAAAVPQELATFGEDVTYTPVTGGAKTIKAIVQRESRQGEYGGGETNETNSIIIRISARNDTEGQVTVNEVESGNAPDTVTIDGKIWIVQRKLSAGANAGTHKLLLQDAANDEGE